ncbi:MAG: hypothetical protein ACPGUV_00320 [Polyangiales bacterium]
MFRTLESIVPRRSVAVDARIRALATLARAGLRLPLSYVLPGSTLNALLTRTGNAHGAWVDLHTTLQADPRLSAPLRARSDSAVHTLAVSLMGAAKRAGAAALIVRGGGLASTSALHWLHEPWALGQVCDSADQLQAALYDAWETQWQQRITHDPEHAMVQATGADAARSSSPAQRNAALAELRTGNAPWASLLVQAWPARALCVRVLLDDVYRGDDTQALLTVTPQPPSRQPFAPTPAADSAMARTTETWRLDKRLYWVREMRPARSERGRRLRARLQPGEARRILWQVQQASRHLRDVAGASLWVVGDDAWIVDLYRHPERNRSRRRGRTGGRMTEQTPLWTPLHTLIDPTLPWCPLVAGLYRKQVTAQLHQAVAALHIAPPKAWFSELAGTGHIAVDALQCICHTAGGPMVIEQQAPQAGLQPTGLMTQAKRVQQAWRTWHFDRLLLRWRPSPNLRDEEGLSLLEMDPRILTAPALMAALHDVARALAAQLAAELISTIALWAITTSTQRAEALARTASLQSLVHSLVWSEDDCSETITRLDPGPHAAPSAPHGIETQSAAALYQACVMRRRKERAGPPNQHGTAPSSRGAQLRLLPLQPARRQAPHDARTRRAQCVARWQRAGWYLRCAWSRLTLEASYRLQPPGRTSPPRLAWWLSPDELADALRETHDPQALIDLANARAAHYTDMRRSKRRAAQTTHNHQTRSDRIPATSPMPSRASLPPCTVADPCHGHVIGIHTPVRGTLHPIADAADLGRSPGDAIWLLDRLRPAHLPLLALGRPLVILHAAPGGESAAWLAATQCPALIALSHPPPTAWQGKPVGINPERGTLHPLP